MKLNIPKTNRSAAVSGVWADFNGEISFKVAKAGNPEHQAELDKYAASIKRARDTNDRRAIKNYNNLMIVECLLKDWRGVCDEEGNEVAYSKEQAKAIIDDDDFESVKLFILETANDNALYEDKLRDEIKKK